MSVGNAADAGAAIGGRATVARMYDYLLGGKQNFPADRAAARQLLQAVPESVDIALANRMFLRRAVRALADLGIRQFLDLGSGIPTQGTVHEIVQGIDREARVLYVDIDPVAVVASNEILMGNPHCSAIEGDFTRPNELLEVLTDSDLASIINLEQPTALLYFSVLHQVPESQVSSVVEPIRSRLVAGSAMAISHVSPVIIEIHGKSNVDTGVNVYRTHAATDIVLRTAEEIKPLFGDFVMLDPGLTRISAWRPDPQKLDPYASTPNLSPMLGGVAVKRVD